MALVYQSSNNGAYSITSTPSMTHDTGTGGNRVLILRVITSGETVSTGTPPTYAGTAMTKVDAQANGSNVEIWYLTNPASGSNTLNVTLSGADSGYLVATTYNGADQTNPIGASNKASGYSTTCATTVNTTSNNNTVLDVAVGSGAPTFVSGPNQTNRLNKSGIPGREVASDKQGNSSGNVTMTWTITPTSVDWAIVAVELREVASPLPSVSDSISVTESVGVNSIFNIVSPMRRGVKIY